MASTSTLLKPTASSSQRPMDPLPTPSLQEAPSSAPTLKPSPSHPSPLTQSPTVPSSSPRTTPFKSNTSANTIPSRSALMESRTTICKPATYSTSPAVPKILSSSPSCAATTTPPCAPSSAGPENSAKHILYQ